MKARMVWGTIGAGMIFAAALSASAQAPAAARAQAGAARQQASRPQAAPPQAAPAAAPALPPAGQRRDPFRPIEIKNTTAVDIVPMCTQAGKQGLLIGQLMLQGIARTVSGEWVAVVDNKTGRAYFLRTKDELCNGVVLRVDQESLVMEERTMDSFGRTRTREVVLRPPQE